MAQTVIEAETETEPEAETEAVAEPVHRGGGRFRETAKTSPAANRQATPRVQGEESGVMVSSLASTRSARPGKYRHHVSRQKQEDA